MLSGLARSEGLTGIAPGHGWQEGPVAEALGPSSIDAPVQEAGCFIRSRVFEPDKGQIIQYGRAPCLGIVHSPTHLIRPHIVHAANLQDDPDMRGMWRMRLKMDRSGQSPDPSGCG